MKTILAIIVSAALLPALAQAQLCNYSITTSMPIEQFHLSDGEVMDFRTNLIWQRCAVGQSWTGTTCEGTADRYTWAESLTAADGTDWRLPNIKELLSIVEVACGSPSINQSVFPNTESESFWTSTPYINNNQVWSVSFVDGNDEGDDKTAVRVIRLVRDVN